MTLEKQASDEESVRLCMNVAVCRHFDSVYVQVTDEAQHSYDALERHALEKERAAAHASRESWDRARDSKDGSGSGREEQVKDSAKERVTSFVSSKQSTFLSGLFSHRAPWDSTHDESV